MGTLPENETLEESLQIVKREANEMKRNFEKEDVDKVRFHYKCIPRMLKLCIKAIEHAGTMLDRLRTSSLSPAQYNELFMTGMGYKI